MVIKTRWPSASRATIKRLVNSEDLPIVKVAGANRYDVEDLARDLL
jgi:hypothetical protein